VKVSHPAPRGLRLWRWAVESCLPLRGLHADVRLRCRWGLARSESPRRRRRVWFCSGERRLPSPWIMVFAPAWWVALAVPNAAALAFATFPRKLPSVVSRQ
jgi:hypothetical protein